MRTLGGKLCLRSCGAVWCAVILAKVLDYSQFCESVSLIAPSAEHSLTGTLCVGILLLEAWAAWMLLVWRPSALVAAGGAAWAGAYVAVRVVGGATSCRCLGQLSTVPYLRETVLGVLILLPLAGLVVLGWDRSRVGARVRSAVLDVAFMATGLVAAPSGVLVGWWSAEARREESAEVDWQIQQSARDGGPYRIIIENKSPNRLTGIAVRSTCPTCLVVEGPRSRLELGPGEQWEVPVRVDRTKLPADGGVIVTWTGAEDRQGRVWARLGRALGQNGGPR